MENHMPMSDFEKEQNINELMEFVHRGDDKCCFCGTEIGALIHLHQGWCCVTCFKKEILKLNGGDGAHSSHD